MISLRQRSCSQQHERVTILTLHNKAPRTNNFANMRAFGLDQPHNRPAANAARTRE